MVKGVNKKIIEVNNPDSIYFEKAVFYLRPEVRILPDEIAHSEIDRYISGVGLPVNARRNTLKKGRVIILSAFVAVVLLVAIILFSAV